MNKLSRISDEDLILESTVKLIANSLKSEINSFYEMDYPEDHNFVNAVLAGRLWNYSAGSKLYEIFIMTRRLIDNPDETLGLELVDIINDYDEDSLAIDILDRY